LVDVEVMPSSHFRVGLQQAKSANSGRAANAANKTLSLINEVLAIGFTKRAAISLFFTSSGGNGDSFPVSLRGSTHFARISLRTL
jgi:hypothetical protein